MSSSSFNLGRFRTEVLSGATLARTNRFEVEIFSPPALSGQYAGELASLYVEQASMPPINIFTKPLKIFGPSYQRPITSEYGGEGISITFHVDGDLTVKSYFEDWMHLVVNDETFTVGYQEEYASTIRIKQLDEQDTIVYDIELIEAFPKSMNIMDLNNASSNQTHRLNVIFGYRYWRRFQETQLEDIPISLVNPQVRKPDVRIPPTRTQPTDTRQWNWQTGELSENPGSSLPPGA